jgi:hypothetical protein
MLLGTRRPIVGGSARHMDDPNLATPNENQIRRRADAWNDYLFRASTFHVTVENSDDRRR